MNGVNILLTSTNAGETCLAHRMSFAASLSPVTASVIWPGEKSASTWKIICWFYLIEVFLGKIF